MNASLAEIIAHSRLKILDADRFSGRASSDSWHRVYGGQVLAQCISAADQTVEPEFVIHSLHSYFLRPGDPAKPRVYEVNRIRDGQNFCTRRLTVTQGEKAIHHLVADAYAAQLDNYTTLPPAIKGYHRGH